MCLHCALRVLLWTVLHTLWFLQRPRGPWRCTVQNSPSRLLLMYCAVGLGTLVLCVTNPHVSFTMHLVNVILYPALYVQSLSLGPPPADRLTALSFQGWLHSLSRMSSRPVHIAVCSRLSFLLETEYYFWCSWTTAGLSVCGSMDWIHLSTVVCNNAFSTTVLVHFGAAIIRRLIKTTEISFSSSGVWAIQVQDNGRFNVWCNIIS